MKRTDNKIGTIAKLVLALLLTNLGYSTAIAQDSPLKHGKMVVNGTTYDVRIRNGHDDIYMYEDSLHEKTSALINPKPGTTNISDNFIFVNTNKLLEIKRRFYGSDVRADIKITITKKGEFMRLDYILPKSPMITEQQFRRLDAEIRKHLKISVVFPTEWVKNQAYHGYATKYI